MVSRAKDVKALKKHLLKRYSSEQALALSDRKLLDILVYALFLENGGFERAFESFDLLERYFIDWNEIRVAKADEIAEVIGDYKGAVRDGERLRRLLQSIFDLTFRFDLDEFRTKESDSFVQFFDAIPYSTSFMNDFVRLFVFKEMTLPCSEGMLRALRLLGLTEVQGDKEVAVLPQKRFTYEELTELFFLLFQFGSDLMNPDKQVTALKFLLTFDKAASARSAEPLVAPKWPSDPREIAKLLSRKERTRKSASTLKDDVRVEASADDEDEHEQDDDHSGSTGEGIEPGETILTMTSESVSSTTVPGKSASKSSCRNGVKGGEVGKRSPRVKTETADISTNGSAPVAKELGAGQNDETVASQESVKPNVTVPKKTHTSRVAKGESVASTSEKSAAEPGNAPAKKATSSKPKSSDAKKDKSSESSEEKIASESTNVKKSAGKKSKSSLSKKQSTPNGAKPTASETSDLAVAEDKTVQSKSKKKTKPVGDGASGNKSSSVSSSDAVEKETKTKKKSSRDAQKAKSAESVESTVKVKTKTKTVKHKDEKVKESQAEPPDHSAGEDTKKRVRKTTNVAESDSVKKRTSVSLETDAPKKKRGSSRSVQDDESKLQEIQQKKPR